MLFLLALLGLAGHPAAALRVPEQKGAKGPAVAAVVAVHPPRFRYLRDFFYEWEKCPQGVHAMDIMPIFSSEADREKFAHFFCTGRELQSCLKALPYRPLLADAFREDDKNPRSWKKIDGVAQVLDSDKEGQYEFLVMLDAEIQLGACEGFSQLLPRLRAKHQGKKWFGDHARGCLHMREASCAVSALSGGGGGGTDRVEFARSEDEGIACHGDLQVMSKLSNETGKFRVMTWWTELPYLQADAARRMFRSWATNLKSVTPGSNYYQVLADAAGESVNKITQRLLSIQEAAMNASEAAGMDSSDEMWPTATDIAERMGKGAKTEALRVAGMAFEHLIYQLYTVVHEGFHVVDLTAGFQRQGGFAMGERFCGMQEEDKGFYMRTVEPLWHSSGCEMLPAPLKPPLILFHVDRALANEERMERLQQKQKERKEQREQEQKEQEEKDKEKEQKAKEEEQKTKEEQEEKQEEERKQARQRRQALEAELDGQQVELDRHAEHEHEQGPHHGRHQHVPKGRETHHPEHGRREHRERHQEHHVQHRVQHRAQHREDRHRQQQGLERHHPQHQKDQTDKWHPEDHDWEWNFRHKHQLRPTGHEQHKHGHEQRAD